ncbi:MULTISPECIES: PQQ-dependent sugar dehydrogenase [unclassified Bradyrhizobium]|uniref:PQQ-dependent sugar dehydrogenase n=1 Tax=unclassified Bradyrhizobium TaxID=2631580 RepID=UPI0024791EAA|nr:MULTISPECIES: PQQ-dependent sugar dehydrogenase [unclassified Bradyrhizobium]WGR73395.1 PQQ-dependent sugar dehydrogenase [Bradyrhizobium sp. ISRA426]WGR78232.1 PQQ-dependent sugar dehydrogenase [Bradyrhizobium sp. ISRA430]WGR88633.1 PQQ-dependent sugar dehydrogenase [Bradyrhizobium sp. ISRA432]
MNHLTLQCQRRSRRSITAVFAAVLLGFASVAWSEPVRRSGYAIGAETCGSGDLAFPRIQLDMKAGFCAGLVASEDDRLKFPRSIIQVPGRDLFVIADMGGWGHTDGRLLLLDPHASEGKRLKELLTKLEYPFGLVLGPDKKLYASTAETIFRFDPLAEDPRSTVETIIHRLPGRRITLPDGTGLDESAHPLKQFVFDRNGRLFVNIGSHSDDCITPAPIRKPCAAAEGAEAMAAIWLFTPPAGGVFPALKPNDPDPPHRVYARGLRNSMALALHPNFPDAGYAFLQGENGRDLPDVFKPNEEINAIEQGRHYGWPYCYDLSTPSPEFKSVLQSGPYRSLCTGKALYKAPLSLMPPHGAPLAMLYYHGAKFPELEGKLLVGLHGYRPTGSRVLIYDVDDHGFPKPSPAPVRYHVSCAAEATRSFQTDGGEVAAAPFEELIAGWHRVNGTRPQGAPVGMTVAEDGAIWLVEDKNQTVIRIDRASNDAPQPLSCDTRSPAQIDQLTAFVAKDAQNRVRLATLRKGLVEKHCMGCHSDFGLKPGQSDVDKDTTVLRFMLSQDGWIYPGDPDSGKLRARLRGLGAEKLMPPGGEKLPKTDAGYGRLLDYADSLVAKMVPGTRMRIKPGPPQRKFFGKANKECGEIPAAKVVVVTQRNAVDRPGFSRFFRPADPYLDGECTDDDGYYIRQEFLVPVQ